MSYCRAGSDDSDVYAYASIGGGFAIYCGGRHYSEDTLPEFKARLEGLRDAGFKVPDSTFRRIEHELHAQNSVEKP